MKVDWARLVWSTTFQGGSLKAGRKELEALSMAPASLRADVSPAAPLSFAQAGSCGRVP